MLDGDTGSPPYELGEIIGDPVRLDVPVLERARVTSDHGDFRYVDDQKISMLRSEDEFTVSFRPGVAVDAAIVELTSVGGVLDGFQVKVRFTQELVMFSRVDMISPLPAGGLPLEALAATGLVAWSNPLLINPENGGWMSPTDQLVVKLRDGVDPHAFFASGYTHYEAFFQGQWIGKLAVGGLNTLQHANELEDDPRVEWASPDCYAEGWLWEPEKPIVVETIPLRTDSATTSATDANQDGTIDLNDFIVLKEQLRAQASTAAMAVAPAITATKLEPQSSNATLSVAAFWATLALTDSGDDDLPG
jgi:hypothetical protein